MNGSDRTLSNLQELIGEDGLDNQSGTVTILVMGQHGLLGEVRASVDLSYLAAVVLLLRFFEVDGAVRKAISVLKTRTTAHEATIREFNLGASGVQVSELLVGFRGVLSGHPVWVGNETDLMVPQAASTD